MFYLYLFSPPLDNPVHRWLRRRGSSHLEGKDHRLLLRASRNLILRSSSGKTEQVIRNHFVIRETLEKVVQIV